MLEATRYYPQYANPGGKERVLSRDVWGVV